MPSKKSKRALINEDCHKLAYDGEVGYIKLEELSPDDFEWLKFRSGLNSLGRKEQLCLNHHTYFLERFPIALKFVVVL